jgi:hypothetical protein
MWKLNSILLNSQESKKKSQGELKNCIEVGEKGNNIRHLMGCRESNT